MRHPQWKHLCKWELQDSPPTQSKGTDSTSIPLPAVGTRIEYKLNDTFQAGTVEKRATGRQLVVLFDDGDRLQVRCASNALGDCWRLGCSSTDQAAFVAKSVTDAACKVTLCDGASQQKARLLREKKRSHSEDAFFVKDARTCILTQTRSGRRVRACVPHAHPQPHAKRRRNMSSHLHS